MESTVFSSETEKLPAIRNKMFSDCMKMIVVLIDFEKCNEAIADSHKKR
jgi:hypothetical protein